MPPSHSSHFQPSDDRQELSEAPDTPAGVDLDRDTIFSLIDRVLPFEACLYHQVLPLSLTYNELRLGMVDLTDVSALDYLRKVLAYLHYRLAPQAMPSDLQHQILSAYLKFKADKNVQPSEPLIALEPNHIDEGFEGPPTIFFERPAAMFDRDEEPTISIQHPIAISSSVVANKSGWPTPQPSKSISTPSQSTLTFALPGSSLPQLQTSSLYINASSEQLRTLNPKELLQMLLGRVLATGIGRLFFEHQGNQGRILWSDSGVFQSFLDCLPLETFNGVMAELKQLTSLSPDPVEEAIQVEIERTHEKNRLLLRLKVMPKPQIGDQPRSEGEDATLQILRGPALRFYQQQQASSIGRDTLTVARQLQRKVEQLHRRSQSITSNSSDELTVMPEIQEVLQTVKDRLIAIERQTNTSGDPTSSANL